MLKIDALPSRALDPEILVEGEVQARLYRAARSERKEPFKES